MRTRLQLSCCVALLLCVAGYAQTVGNITTVAGTGTGGYAGDGGLSISAKIYLPFGVAVFPVTTSSVPHSMYIAVPGQARIRRVTLQ